MSRHLRALLSPGLVEPAGGGKMEIKTNYRPGHRPLSVGIVGTSIIQTNPAQGSVLSTKLSTLS